MDDKQGGAAAGKNEQEKFARFTITLDQVQDYEFHVKFDKAQFQDLMTDEPPPLGRDTAPNASRLLAAAVGNCLSASLVFCARKARLEMRGLHTEVSLQYARNEKGRLRVGKIDVVIVPKFDESQPEKTERCLGLFEDYCTVSQSVRAGIPMSVSVRREANGS
jgi:uncharacterized OsmC-like protein